MGGGRNDLAFINRSISRVVQLLVVIILLESKFGLLSLFLGLIAHHFGFFFSFNVFLSVT